MKMSLDRRKWIKLLGVAGAVTVFDQITKAIVLEAMPLFSSIPVISGFFNITHVHNPGGAFGFLAGAGTGVRHLVFLAFTVMAIGMVFYFYAQTPRTQPLLETAFALILGGAAGNMIDRVRLGEVVDFLDFYMGDLHWPAFNIADSAVTIGVGIFVIHLLFHREES
jgi:signal peptidase II